MPPHQTSCHPTRPHATPPDLMPPHQTSCHPTRPHATHQTRPHATPPDLMPPHQTSCHLTRPHATPPDPHATPPDLTPPHQTSRHPTRPPTCLMKPLAAPPAISHPITHPNPGWLKTMFVEWTVSDYFPRRTNTAMWPADASGKSQANHFVHVSRPSVHMAARVKPRWPQSIRGWSTGQDDPYPPTAKNPDEMVAGIGPGHNQLWSSLPANSIRLACRPTTWRLLQPRQIWDQGVPLHYQ